MGDRMKSALLGSSIVIAMMVTSLIAEAAAQGQPSAMKSPHTNVSADVSSTVGRYCVFDGKLYSPGANICMAAGVMRHCTFLSGQDDGTGLSQHGSQSGTNAPVTDMAHWAPSADSPNCK